jgi:hypothetical protein
MMMLQEYLTIASIAMNLFDFLESRNPLHLPGHGCGGGQPCCEAVFPTSAT